MILLYNSNCFAWDRSDLFRGQRNDLSEIVGLNFHIVRRLISADLAAFFTAVNDDVAFFGIGLHLDRAQNAAAGVGAVAGVDIHVQRAKTARTVVAGAVAKGLDGQTAVFADEGIVIFGKSFLFHKISP